MIVYYRTPIRDQRQRVAGYFSNHSEVVNREWVERRGENTALFKSIQFAKETGDTLLIAEMGHFFYSIPVLEALHTVNFVCLSGCKTLDGLVPTPENLPTFLVAATAFNERVSAGTKRGTKLHPKTKFGHGRITPRAVRAATADRIARTKAHYAPHLDLMQGWKDSGLSYQAIANLMNSAGKVTTRGKPYTATAVFRILTRQ